MAQTETEKVAEHQLTNGEIALFAEIHQSFDRLRTLIAMFLCDKHGYPSEDPIGFEFDWKNKKVIARRPKAESKFEVTKDEPSEPTSQSENKASKRS